MKRRPSHPLLRVAAMGTTLSCSSLAGSAPPQDPEPAVHAASRVHLRGVISFAGPPGDRVYLQVADGSGVTATVRLEPGPWPRPFHVSDADLGGITLTGETVQVTAFVEIGERFNKAAITVPLRASGLWLTPGPAVPPLPSDAVPTREAVLAMPPIRPDQPGSRLDLQGVLVFDNRRGIPKMGVHVHDGKGGVIHMPLQGRSPVQFRIQDADMLADYPLKGDTLTLSTLVHFGDGKMLEQAITVPAKSAGIVLVPTYEGPPAPPPPKLKAARLDLRGVVNAPVAGNAREVSIYVMHGAGTSPAVVLPDGPWPRPFHLAGPDWADIPMNADTVTVIVRVTVDNGADQTDVLTVPLVSEQLVFQPKVVVPTDGPKQPVYANTKGSRYDDGFDDSKE